MSIRVENENYFKRYSQTERVICSVLSGEPINSSINKALIYSLARQRVGSVDPLLPERAKIALVIPYHPLNEIGGLEIGTMQIARCLRDLGQDVEIISRAVYLDNDLSGVRMTPDGIKVHGVGRGIEDIVPFLLAREKHYDLVQWMEIFPPIPEDPEVYNDKAEQQYLSSVLLRSMGKRVYLYVATSGNVSKRGTNNDLWSKIHQPFNALLKAGFTGFNYANVEIAGEYEKAGLTIGEKDCQFIPFGVDTDKFRPVSEGEKNQLREELGLPKAKVIFFFLGRFVARKKPDFLLDVWGSLPDEVRQKAHFVLIGGGASSGHPDSIYTRVKEKIDKSMNITNYDLVPHQLMPRYIQACDVLAFPSEREGWPLALMEVMSCGKMVIASDIEGVRDIIDTPEKGILLPVGDFNQWQQQFVSTVLDPERALLLGKNGREAVVSKYGWQAIANAYLSFYRR